MSEGERSRVVRQERPFNAGTPMAALADPVVPNRLFYVRSHFEVPEIDPGAWRLSVGGAVERPLELSLAGLKELPRREVAVTLECAGNGRTRMRPVPGGTPWDLDAVSTARFAGASLAPVLEQAGVAESAVEILFAGADRGEVAPGRPEAFERSLPVADARDPDTILAWEMNGEPLPPDHGRPVRLVVPRWYGVASVKWLCRIEAVSEPFQGYFQTVKYTIQRKTGRGEVTEVVGEMPPKSEILRPSDKAELGIGTNRIFGFAWAGEDAVARVEVSVDGGESWGRAELNGPQAPYSWTLWEYLWEVSAPGEYTLLSRAISQGGQVQPMDHDPLWGGYLITFSRPTTVTVRPGLKSDFLGGTGALRRELEAAVEERARLPLDVEMQFDAGGGI